MRFLLQDVVAMKRANCLSRNSLKLRLRWQDRTSDASEEPLLTGGVLKWTPSWQYSLLFRSRRCGHVLTVEPSAPKSLMWPQSQTEFSVISFHIHLSHCTFLPPSKLYVMSPKATCHISGCCHLTNSVSCHPSDVLHCRVLRTWRLDGPGLRTTA